MALYREDLSTSKTTMGLAASCSNAEFKSFPDVLAIPSLSSYDVNLTFEGCEESDVAALQRKSSVVKADTPSRPHANCCDQDGRW